MFGLIAVIVVRVKKQIEIMQNLPMLTEDEFTGLVVNIAGLLFLIGLVYWFVSAWKKRLTNKKVFKDAKPISSFPIRDVNGLTEEDRKRLGSIISEHSYGHFEYNIPRRDTSTGISYDRNHLHLDYNPTPENSWVHDTCKEESISDKINRLRKEMQENIDNQDYLACARLKKELDKLYATKTSTKDLNI
jgi:hypothetical protein